MSPFTQFESEPFTVQDASDRGIAPHGLARPHAFCGERREKASVNGAAERDRAVGNGEDVLPERVAGPEGLHRGEVCAPARFDGVVRSVRRLRRRRSGDRRARASCDDVPRGHRNPRGQRGEYQDGLRAHRGRSDDVSEHGASGCKARSAAGPDGGRVQSMSLRNLCEIRPSTRESRWECSNLDQVRVTSLNLLRQIGIVEFGQIPLCHIRLPVD